MQSMQLILSDDRLDDRQLGYLVTDGIGIGSAQFLAATTTGTGELGDHLVTLLAWNQRTFMLGMARLATRLPLFTGGFGAFGLSVRMLGAGRQGRILGSQLLDFRFQFGDAFLKLGVTFLEGCECRQYKCLDGRRHFRLDLGRDLDSAGVLLGCHLPIWAETADSNQHQFSNTDL
jgi:hypothetical protein